jgi:hypothetical protein
MEKTGYYSRFFFALKQLAIVNAAVHAFVLGLF